MHCWQMLSQTTYFLILLCFFPGVVIETRDSGNQENILNSTRNLSSDGNVTELFTTESAPIEPPIAIDIKLINGRQPHEGLVLIKPNTSDIWGTICDDGWDDADATVVCRQLGHKAGLARYPPLFGGENDSVPIYLDDVWCSGEESTLLECQYEGGWGRNNCNHREDAAVECFINEQKGSERIFGYPAVPRRIKDAWKEGVYIPHPHQHLPWGQGFITGWTFVTDTKGPSDITLQIWRQKSTSEFQLKGETAFVGLTSGLHSYRLNKSDRIEFNAGDVVGMAFPDNNPIPFDNRVTPCENGEVLYMVGGGSALNRLEVGNISWFNRKPEAWSSCRVYSLYVTYKGIDGKNSFGCYDKTNVVLIITNENKGFSRHRRTDQTNLQGYFQLFYYNDTNTFTYGNSVYHIEMSLPLTQPSSQRQCRVKYGPRAKLASIQSEFELMAVTGALNSLGVAPHMYWVGGNVHQEKSQYYKWAHCEPSSGKECIILQNNKSVLADLSSDQFLMASEKCSTQRSYICKLTESTSTAVISPTSSAHTKSSPTKRGISKGAIAGLTIIPLLVLGIILVGFIVKRLKSQKYHRTGESTVGFVHLEDDKI